MRSGAIQSSRCDKLYSGVQCVIKYYISSAWFSLVGSVCGLCFKDTLWLIIRNWRRIFFVVLILPYLAIFMIHTTFLSLLGLICLNSLPCCCCFSVAKSCPNLCDPMNSSTPDFPVLHYIPEFGKTHVHQVSDAIQPYNPLSLPSLLAFSLSQHQGLFQWVSSHQMAKYWSFSFSTILPMYIQGWFPLGLTGLISL